jgi:hypothetical protein
MTMDKQLLFVVVFIVSKISVNISMSDNNVKYLLKIICFGNIEAKYPKFYEVSTTKRV